MWFFILLCSVLSPVRWCYCLYVTFSLGCVQKPFSSSSSYYVPCFHCSPVSAFWKGTCCHSTFTGLHGVSAASVFNTHSIWRGFIHLGERGEGIERLRVERVLVLGQQMFLCTKYHLLKAKSASPQPLGMHRWLSGEGSPLLPMGEAQVQPLVVSSPLL